jgi:hypothetical protein
MHVRVDVARTDAVIAYAILRDLIGETGREGLNGTLGRVVVDILVGLLSRAEADEMLMTEPPRPL